MRITNSGASLNFLQNVANQRQQLDRLNQEMSSGRKLLRPSDDPLAAQQSLSVRSSLSRNDQYSKNIQDGQSRLQNVDSISDSLQLTLDKAVQLTTQGLSGATTATERATLSTQIQTINQQILSVANTNIQGQYIFGGTKTDSPPFTSTNNVVTYNGNTDAIYTRIDDNTLAQTNVTGQDLFTGTKDVFATLNSIQQAFNSNDTTALKQGLADLKDVLDHTSIVRGQIGATLNHFQQRSGDIQQQSLQLTADKSNLEDADIVSTAVKSNQAQVALQASLSAGARVISTSLLDFLK